MLYALSILLLVSSVYAILGTQLFGDRSQEHFGRFSLALFTVPHAHRTWFHTCVWHREEGEAGRGTVKRREAP